MSDVPADDSLAKLLAEPEDLHPDLHPYCYEDDTLGTCIKHPLVFSIMHTAQLNAIINRNYEQKLEAVREATDEGNWSRVIAMYERPFRLTALRSIAHRMTDVEYWETVAFIWIDTENVWELEDEWRKVLTAPRGKRHRIMDEDERHVFLEKKARLRNITVWRGYTLPERKYGMSWTTDKQKAEWFAYRFLESGGSGNAHVAKGFLSMDLAIAYFDARNESEIVALPENVIIVENRPLA